MKKILSLFVALLAISSVMALDLSASKWSLRGNIEASNIVNLKGMTVSEVYVGKINTYANLQRGSQTQGELILQALAGSESVRFTVSWQHHGLDYGTTLISDDQMSTVFTANARTIYNREVTYGVPITVTYHKNTNTFDVVGPDFSFTGIDVVNLMI